MCGLFSSFQFVDNDQSLLVADAHLDNDLPDAMKLVMHLAEAAKAATIGRVSRTMGAAKSKSVVFSIAEADGASADADKKEPPQAQGKLASMMESVLRPIQTKTAAAVGATGSSSSPPKAAAGGGGAMAGMAELLRKTAALGRGGAPAKGGDQEKAPLLGIDSNSSSPARGYSEGGATVLMHTSDTSGKGGGSAVVVQAQAGGLREVASVGSALTTALLVAAGKRSPGQPSLRQPDSSVGKTISSGSTPRSVELFSYLESAKQQQQQGAVKPPPPPANKKTNMD